MPPLNEVHAKGEFAIWQPRDAAHDIATFPLLISGKLKKPATRQYGHVGLTYAEMAGHYGTAILPARPYRPRDKAKVEVAVQVAQRWILARLRNRRFFSLAELNAAICWSTS